MRRRFALVALVALLAGCAVRRPVAQPLSEARYFHAEDALAKASDRVAEKILARLPKEGPLVVVLPASGGERANRVVRSLLFLGLTTARDMRLVPHAALQGAESAPGPTVEVVTLAAGPELLADLPPKGDVPCSVFHLSVLVRVHEKGQLLWSDILGATERELPLTVRLEVRGS